MGTSEAEAHGAKHSCKIRHIHRPLRFLVHNTLIDEILESKEPGDVCLCLLESRAQFLHLLPDRCLSPVDGDGVWPESVHQLVRQDMREERLEGDQRLLADV